MILVLHTYIRKKRKNMRVMVQLYYNLQNKPQLQDTLLVHESGKH